MGEKILKQVSAKKEEDMQRQSLCWERPGGDRRAEQISRVATCNTTWQQHREQQSVLIRMKRDIKTN